MADSSKQKPTLLTLPGELQNHIYRLAVVKEDYIDLDRVGQIEPRPGLMLACRELRQAVGSIYYGENVFLIDAPSYKRDLQIARSFEHQAGPMTRKITQLSMYTAPVDGNEFTQLDLSFGSNGSLLTKVTKLVEGHPNASQCYCFLPKACAEATLTSRDADRNPLFALFEIVTKALGRALLSTPGEACVTCGGTRKGYP